MSNYMCRGGARSSFFRKKSIMRKTEINQNQSFRILRKKNQSKTIISNFERKKINQNQSFRILKTKSVKINHFSTSCNHVTKVIRRLPGVCNDVIKIIRRLPAVQEGYGRLHNVEFLYFGRLRLLRKITECYGMSNFVLRRLRKVT